MRNIIFDFGNVLVKWEPERVYARHFGDEARAWWFMRHVCDADWRNRIDAGESLDGCVAELQALWPEYADAVAMYRDGWMDMLTGEMPGMREVLADLKGMPGVRLFGLSNWSMETFPEARRRFPILQEVDDYVVSGEEGLVKPDPEIFRRLLDRYGLCAEDCTFIDDSEANVEAARGLGMHGVLFRGADALRVELGMQGGGTGSCRATALIFN